VNAVRQGVQYLERLFLFHGYSLHVVGHRAGWPVWLLNAAACAPVDDGFN
jgi:hypothetical protein